MTECSVTDIGYCASKLAQKMVVETVSKEVEGKGWLAVGIHLVAVKTSMAVGDAPEESKTCRFSSYKDRAVGADRRPDLIDSVDLCGGFCVWLTGTRGVDQ